MSELVSIIGQHAKHRRDQLILHTLSRDAYAAFPKSWNIHATITSNEQCKSFRTWLIRHGHTVDALDLTVQVYDSTLLGTLCTLMHVKECRISMMTGIEPFFLESMMALEHCSLTCQNATFPCWYMMPPRLTSLELTARGMVHISPHFGTAFAGLKDLRITAKHITMTTYPSTLTRLELHGRLVNEEAGVSELRTLTHLHHLALTHCHLTYVPRELEALHGLTRLELCHNSISSYDPDGFLHHDVMSSLRNMTQLKYLNLSHNDLSNATMGEFDALRLGSLETLDISHNSDALSHIPARGLYLNNLRHVYATFVPNHQFFDIARHLEEFIYRSADHGLGNNPIHLVSLSVNLKKVTVEGASIPSQHIQPFLNLVSASPSYDL